ncbi:MAG: hypothetical protein KGJ72_04480, partial [Gammaproteobacteria bacterium]|nr:hypothetical protein [Gammaproteobacteria bacterium]
DAISFACEEFAVSLPDIEGYIGHKIPSAPIGPDLLAAELAEGEPAPHRRRPTRGGPRRPHHSGHSGHSGGHSGGHAAGHGGSGHSRRRKPRAKP